MTCCLTTPSHCLNQFWLFISAILWHSPESYSSTHATILYNEFENYTFKLISAYSGSELKCHINIQITRFSRVTSRRKKTTIYIMMDRKVCWCWFKKFSSFRGWSVTEEQTIYIFNNNFKFKKQINSVLPVWHIVLCVLHRGRRWEINYSLITVVNYLH